MVVCNCKYCGTKIAVPEGIQYEGGLADVLKYIERVVDEKSDSCPCRQENSEE